MTAVFDLAGPLLEGVFAIEASAGTGKTYSLTGLVARHVAERGLRAEQLLMVTFTRAATADMRDRTRDSCRSLLRLLETAPLERSDLGADAWMLDVLSGDENVDVERAGNLRAFLGRYDEATITTIHGFCQLVLNRSGLLSPALGDVTLVGDASETIAQVVSDILIGPLSENPNLFGDSPSGSERSIGTCVADLEKIVKAVMSNPSTLRIPAVTTIDDRADVSEADAHEWWATTVERVLSVVHERRRAARVFGYDDLIHSVRDLLSGDDGQRVVRSLRDQFRLVLIDEFQDTDIGQWTIFDDAFVRPTGRLDKASTVAIGVVGDPKQAIYRFRGADIDAYRSAVSSIDQRVELVTNYRSNSRLITAVNHLFDGVTFGDSTIAYRQVSSRPGPVDEGIVGQTPLEIRYFPYCTQGGSSPITSGLRKAERLELENGTLDKWAVNTDLAMDHVYADMLASIADLIGSGSLIDKSGRPRPIRPGDIAVLVRSHSHAERIRDEFAKARIPAVRYRASSVFKTSAALEWRIFLAALAAPSRIDRIRAVALSVFGRAQIGDVSDGLDGNTEIESWQRTIAEWSAEVHRLGLPSVYFRLRCDRVFMTRVMSEVDGERLLTDLDHIAEVLASSPEVARGAGAADCLALLDRLADEAGEDDEFQRRIETDAEAVHIATIHHSKGLEFPVVFLPTLMKMYPGGETPFVFSSGGRRVIDLATPVEWTWAEGSEQSRDDRKAAVAADITSDLMRMLYVAVTRAEHKVVMYWTPLRSAADSSLGRILFAPRTEGRVNIDPLSGVPEKGKIPKSNREMRETLEYFTNPCPDITIREVGHDLTAVPVVPPHEMESENVAVADFTRREPVRRPGWGKWSYSGIANTLGTVSAALAEPFVPGADEGHSRHARLAMSADTQQSLLFPDHLFGATFGSRIHEIFEAVDPSSPDFVSHLHHEVSRRFDRTVDSATVSSVVGAIEAVCRTPLGPLFEGGDLAAIAPKDRLAEMVFDMRIPDSPVAVSRIGRILTEHLEVGDPFIAYGETLVSSAARIRMAGYLYGEIDALFRIHRADGTWSAIVSDYKTNLLHEPTAANPLESYDRANLARVMAEDHYVLQALIYQVAVHRYLRWRIDEYRPDVHLGGIAYLFVRGLIGPDTPVGSHGEPMGVFTWKPPISLIEALDAELST